LKLLLDTHVFLWWDVGDPAMGRAARAAIADPANTVYVSAASVWEIAIKRAKGKLTFSGSPVAAIVANGFVALPMAADHAEAAGALEWTHADPFDRMLVAQAQAQGLVLCHADETIAALGCVGQLWARE
jgi:PIN domain nuclease of toxin-antitoxin system